jgi:hypothetical protein
MERLPDVVSLSRALAGDTQCSVLNLQDLLREIVLDRPAALGLRTVLLDFDGSVIGADKVGPLSSFLAPFFLFLPYSRKLFDARSLGIKA